MPPPLEYSDETAYLICSLLAEGKSLRTIVQLEGMPAMSTVFKWLDRVPEFAEQYARAREAQADALADEILDIADAEPQLLSAGNGEEGETAIVKVDSAFEQWRKTRIDARKWTAMKLKPKKYGERLTQELTGKDGKDLPVGHEPSIHLTIVTEAEKEST